MTANKTPANRVQLSLIEQGPRTVRPVTSSAASLQDELDRLRGVPVVVNFWADYCPPCRRELPMLQRAAIAGKGHFAFLGVLTRPASMTAAEHFGYTPYPSILDRDGALLTSVGGGIGSIPITVFYDARGVKQLVHMGPYSEPASLIADARRYATR